MMMWMRMKWMVCGGMALAYLVALTVPGRAAEPAADFLRELRERKYFDTAIEYLDQMADSPISPTSFKETIPYERGVTLVEGAKYQRDFSLREKQLDSAQAALKEFLEKTPENNLSFAAKSQLGNVTVERARLKVERAKRPNEVANKAKLHKESRVLYDDAYKVFHTLDDDLKERLKQIPNDINEKSQNKLWTQRENLRADYLQTQLLAAAVLEETADVADKASKDQKDLLTKAAKEYNDLYEKYRTRLAGLYARMYQGRCYQKMGMMKDALSYLDELLQQPDEDAFHPLKTKALLLAIECYLDPSQKKYVEIIDKGMKWIDKARPNEIKSDEFMEMRVLVAKAILAYSDELKAKDAKGNAKTINQMLTDGKKMLQYVLKYPNDSQKDAKSIIGGFGGIVDDKSSTHKEPKNFAEARDAGKESLDGLKVASTTVQTLPERIKGEKDPEEKKKLEEQLKQAKETLKDASSEALHYFQRALALVDKETSKEDLELVYYLLSYLNYTHEQYYDAGLIGEFLARRSPDAGGAKQCAKIAMASYLKIYSETKANGKTVIEKLLKDYDKDNDDKLSIAELEAVPEEIRNELITSDIDRNGKLDQNEMIRAMTRFESDRIVDLSRYMSTKWAGTAEADEALNTLISFMITEGELAKAEKYLGEIPEDSPQRGSAELKTGQAMWGNYLRGMQSIREQEEKAKQLGTEAASAAPLNVKKTELQEVKVRAETTLKNGVTRMAQTGRIDNTLVTAALSLAQIYVDTNQTPKAIEILNDAKFGPLVLAKQNHEATTKKGFSDETYKTSLRAYISSLADSKDAEGAIAKAKEIMATLKTTIGGSEEGSKQLITIYVSLARDLEQQMKLATPENRKSLSKGFQTFLDEVGKGTKELDVLFWIASTYKGMGESMGDAKSTDAKAYLDKANGTYQDILDRGKKKEVDLKPEMRSQIMLELARTKRTIGEYDKAMTIFREVLSENSLLLNVQVEASKTYQEWAKAAKEPKYYVAAMSGELNKATGKKSVWGWGDLAKKTAGNPKFHNAFYDARFNLALAQLEFSLAQTAADKKLEYLKRAKSYLETTVQLYPHIEGDGSQQQNNFRDDYDKLLKRIQHELKEKETGLAGLAQPAATPANGATPTKSGTSPTPAPVPAPAKKAGVPITKN